MKIIITGISGTLGYDLCGVLAIDNEIVGVDTLQPGYDFKHKFLKLDFTDTENTYQLVSKENPDIIIHAGAYTDVDGCETDPRKAYAVNAFGTRNLLTAAGRYDSIFMYISTDYVFDGKSSLPYMENEPPNPVSVYAKSKYWGECFVRDMAQKYFIVRTSWLYGNYGSNFAKGIVRALEEGKNYTAVKDMTASPTFSLDLAIAVSQLVRTKKFGLYHITNSGLCSRYEFAEELKRLMGNKAKGRLEKSDLKALKLPAERPKYSVLNNFCYANEGFGILRNWKEALRNFAANYGSI